MKSRPDNGFMEKHDWKSIQSLLLRGVAGGGIVTILAAIIALVAEVVFARVLGTQQYGIFVYATTMAALLSLVARLGMDASLIRFVPGYIAHGEWGLIRGMLRLTNRLVAINGIVLCVIFVTAGLLVSTGWGTELQITIIISSLMVPIFSIGSVYQFANRAFKRVVPALLPLNVLAPLLLILLVLFLNSASSAPITASLGAAINVFALLVATAMVVLLFGRLQPVQMRSAIPEYRIQEWLGVAVTMFFITGAHQITSQTDTVMLGAMDGTDKAGLYNAAARLAMLSAFPLYITNFIGAPLISELFATKRIAELQKMLRAIVRFTSLATLLITAVLVVTGEYLLRWYGNDFVVSYPALLVLLAGQVINTCSGATGHLLMQTGHHRAAASIMAFASILNILLNFILIPRFGMLGAALATTISLGCWNVGMVYYARRQLLIDPSILSLFKHA